MLLAGCKSADDPPPAPALADALAQAGCAERAPDAGPTAAERVDADVLLASVLRERWHAAPGDRFLALPYAGDNPAPQVETQRVCSQPEEGLAECVIFECQRQAGRSACVEYVVSARVFQDLDPDAAPATVPAPTWTATAARGSGGRRAALNTLGRAP